MLGAAMWVGALTQSWTSPWSICAFALVLIALAGVGRNVIIAILAIAMLLGSAVMSLRQMSLEKSQVTHHIGSRVCATFQVTSDPVRSKAKVFGSGVAPVSFSFLASARSLGADGSIFHLRTPIRVFASDAAVAHVLPGQLVRACGVIKKSKEARVAGNLLVRGPLEIITLPSRWARALGQIRDGLRKSTRSGDAGSLIPGMVLGDTSLQSEDFRISMKRSGLTHLVAVSGANFAIISLFVLWCAQWFFRSLRLRLIFAATALASFIALVRPSPSVLRAAAMAGVVLVARGMGKRAEPIPALGFAIAAVVIGDPWQAKDPGFALSVLATAGLLLLAPRLSLYFSRYLPKSLASALSVPLAAVIMCAPVLVALSGYFGLMTVIANLLASPMVAPITIIGFIASLFSPFAPSIAHLLLSSIYFPACWIAGVAHWASAFPVLNIGKGLLGFLLTLLAVVAVVKAKRLALTIAVVLIVAANWIGSWPGGEWEIANCDVGQGDSLAINLGEHKAIVIDTGPDPASEDRCLTQLGVRSISLLILTHFHADHVEGLAGLLRGRRVGNVWVSNNKEPLIESQKVARFLFPLILQSPLAGATATIPSFRGPVSLRVFWPTNTSITCEDLPGDGSAINNSSLALDIRTRDFSLFASGDIEPCPQSQITEGHVDILKVPHHGSEFQDLPFLERLRPTISIISVGAGNSYGHPSPRTIASLARLRSTMYRTDLAGSIAVKARNHHFSVRTSGGAWWKKVRLG